MSISIIIKKTVNRYKNSNPRTKRAIENSILSLLVKFVSVICSLIIVPLTLGYINPTRYGIWLTLSGIIGWVHFFDLGLGNGFRNRFAEAKAKGDNSLAQEYVSTTYFAIGSIVLVVYSIALIVNHFVDWTDILGVEDSFQEELRKVFAVVLSFICLNMVVNLFATLLTADQKNGYASIIGGAGQVLSVIVIYILTKVSNGSLLNLALYYSSIPCILMLVVSLYMYNFSTYKIYRPTFRRIRPYLIKNLLGLGINFFVIYICMILVFQLVNIVISREIGPEGVSMYNVAYKYFNILYMTIIIFVTPYWSAFTEAYTQHDFSWMKATLKKLDWGLNISVLIAFIMLPIAPLFYKYWIGNQLEVPFVVSFALMALIIATNYAVVYMYIINGIGTIRIQLIAYILSAAISWPILVASCRLFGLPGIVVMPASCYLIQAVLARIQLKKIMDKTAKGMWLK